VREQPSLLSFPKELVELILLDDSLYSIYRKLGDLLVSSKNFGYIAHRFPNDFERDQSFVHIIEGLPTWKEKIKVSKRFSRFPRKIPVRNRLIDLLVGKPPNESFIQN
jgi:hypothetical protein